jgi:triacylglycerol esterase/lipase EstA (alpha/beta hydrolase family)
MSNFKLINEGKSPENLVVFIHGFTGAGDTWEKKDGSMPFVKPLIDKNLNLKSALNIGLFSYKSSALGGNKSDAKYSKAISEVIRKVTNRQRDFNQPIYKVAQFLKTEIDLYIEENDLGSVNLTLIAHSMGGLVCKCFILDNLNDKRYCIKAFHSIHVPYQGSDQATVLNTITLGSNNNQVIELKPDSKLTKLLNNEWLSANIRKLPYTYYYIGESDETTESESAFATERRKEGIGFEKIIHNGGHSNFLDNADNVVWRKVNTSLKKHLVEAAGLEEPIKNEKLQVEQALHKIALEAVEANKELERLYPKCTEYNCLEYKSVELINKIEKYLSLYTEITDDNKPQIKAEIKYLLKIIRLYLVNPNLPIDDIGADMPELSKLCQIETVLDFVEEKVLHSCTCETKSQFDNFLRKVNSEVELRTC